MKLLYTFLKYTFLILSIASFIFQIYLVLYIDPLEHKRLFVLNLFFIDMISLPLSIVFVPLAIGSLIAIDAIFGNSNVLLNDYPIINGLMHHILFVLLVYLQWFVVFPKIKQWLQKK